MINPDIEQLFYLRQIFTTGTRIKLIEMQGENIPCGTVGIVRYVDDAKQIHVSWANGSSLALVPGVDKYEIIRNIE